MSVTSHCKTLLARLVSPFFAYVLRKWSDSWRKERRQMSEIDRLVAAGERVIVVFWHGKYLPLFALAEGRNATVFASECFRGEIIVDICRRFGYQTVLIANAGYGNNRFHQVESALKSARIGALALDGPLGPYHRVKPGVIKLASRLGYLIVPASVACHPKRVMENRWDRRELPGWSAKVSLVLGDPVRIPANLKAGELKAWSLKIKAILEALDQHAEGQCQRESA